MTKVHQRLCRRRQRLVRSSTLWSVSLAAHLWCGARQEGVVGCHETLGIFQDQYKKSRRSQQLGVVGTGARRHTSYSADMLDWPRVLTQRWRTATGVTHNATRPDLPANAFVGNALALQQFRQNDCRLLMAEVGGQMNAAAVELSQIQIVS